MKILLVEDDILVGEALLIALQKNNYTINWVKDGEAAISTLSLESYFLILLDIGLPKINGLDILKHIRTLKIETPVIFITARDTINEKVSCLDAGADDYLVKPFSLEELNARIRSVTRRKRGYSSNIISSNNLTLNLDSKIVQYNKKEILLTAREYSLLYELINKLGVILSKEQLEEKIYGWNEEVASNSIEFIIHCLRKKLNKKIIKNIRGLGWMISK